MSYLHSLPSSVSFTGKGLLGYTFGPLRQKNLEVYYIEVEKGHDVFMISKKITRTYYVLSGAGYFTIGDRKYDVVPGVLVEVPPKVEYCYSGKMKLLAVSRPRWFSGNDTFTKWNPDVVGHDSKIVTDYDFWLARLVRVRCFGKSPVNAYLRINQQMWDKTPSAIAALRPVRAYGDLLHRLARMQNVRSQAFSTQFLRNRPALELMRRLLAGVGTGDALRVAVLGCSTGAEAYSVAWRIHSARPDIRLSLNAVDISKQAVEFAKVGEYSLATAHLTGTKVFETLSPAEMEELFQRSGDRMIVRSWIKEGMSWHVGDAGDPLTIDTIGKQDLVVANNFLCHMSPSEAERCLRNIGRLVNSGGYLFVSGIDLDVRMKVARDLGWEPLQEMLEEIHEGDKYMRRIWPGQYASLEPLNKKMPDWGIRYAAAFQLPHESIERQLFLGEELNVAPNVSESV
jgi:chemotaxis methyl-accepting protein methylase/quercetin dioxygenase-like cupin family protein